MLLPITLIVAAYLCGAIPFGLLVARARGVDVRRVGSGNIGATNVARAVGKGLGLLVLVLDLAKGLGPVLAAWALLAPGPQRHVWIAGAMFAAVVGHVFPVYLRFRGGKGVATALGVTLAVCPWAGLAGLLLYLAIVGVTRVSALGSLVGVAAAVAVVWLLRLPLPIALCESAIMVLVFARHHHNLRRLLRREENPL